MNKISETRASVWLEANEFNEMLAELKAEDDAANSRLKKEVRAKNEYVTPEETNLDRLISIWQSVFPNRLLDFSGHTPQVTSTHQGGSPVTYNANTMSDGERAAIYLIARVLRTPAGLVVIDEPEVHFHGLLARTFWDKVEEAKPDCRFVYITHDIPFALSRQNVQIGIVENDTKARMIPANTSIPSEIIQDILGAASLSLVANTIIFTEGKPGSLDEKIYGSWFITPGKVSVQVSSCNAVREAVRIFGSNPQIINNANFSGIVERDYYSEPYLTSLASKPNLHVLSVNEIESLLCIRPVALAISQHIGKSDEDFNKIYSSFEDEVRKTFTSGRLNGEILKRVNVDIDNRVSGLAQMEIIPPDLGTIRTNLIESISKALANLDAGVIFDEHQSILSTSLAASADIFLKVFPGKDCLNILTRNLGMTQDDYVELICQALKQQPDRIDPLFENLTPALITALEIHLPAR